MWHRRRHLRLCCPYWRQRFSARSIGECGPRWDDGDLGYVERDGYDWNGDWCGIDGRYKCRDEA